jgi:syntaxin 1B/2/3
MLPSRLWLTGAQNDLQPQAAPRLQHGASEYSQASQYSHEPPAAPLTHGPTPYSQQDFLARRDGVNGRITQLSSMIQEVATIHQRLLSSPDNRASAQLEGIIAETQRRNSEIKDEIKFLEREASRDPANSLKRTQVELLKRTFKSQLDDFYKEESDYSKRYREAIARQYKIINPEATEAEVQEAANADWRDDGIFQQAVCYFSNAILNHS